jgi:uncharacterized protein
MILRRRQFLLGSAALGGAVALDAFAVEPRWLEVAERAARVPGLPRALEGFRIAQVSDAHLKSFGRVEQGIVAAVRRENVGLVVLTGDIVDSPRSLPVLSELCSGLVAAGAEVVATLGNWEHWAAFTAAGLAGEYRRLGARLLVNESALVAGVALAASDDGYAGQPRLDRTFADAELWASGAPRLFLTHSPAMFDLLSEGTPRFDLGLAGHTHGGQLRAGPLAPWIPPGSGRFVAGEYSSANGPVYVSRGTGTSVVSARFLCRPELAIFRLSAA